MRSPHFGVKPRGPTSCVNFSSDTQGLGGFSTPVENSDGSKADKSAFAQGWQERWEIDRMSRSSAYGHGAT